MTKTTQVVIWDEQVHGPEQKIVPGKEINWYFWSEVRIGDEKHRFSLAVPLDVRHEFEKVVGRDYDNVLRDCLRNHVRELIRNYGWVPACNNDNFPVSRPELLKDLRAYRKSGD